MFVWGMIWGTRMIFMKKIMHIIFFIFWSLMPYILYNNYFDLEQDILCKLCEGDGYQQETGV